MSPKDLYVSYAAQSELPAAAPPPPAAELELEPPQAVSSTEAAARPATAVVAVVILRSPMGSASLKGRRQGWPTLGRRPSACDENLLQEVTQRDGMFRDVTIAQPWHTLHAPARPAEAPRAATSACPQHRRGLSGEGAPPQRAGGSPDHPGAAGG